jgi:hypothetical protein
MKVETTHARLAAYAVSTCILLEVIASTLLGVALGLLMSLGGSASIGVIARITAGLNANILLVEAFSYGHPAVWVASIVSYLVAIVLLWFVSRRAGVTTTADVDELLSNARERLIA